MTAVHSPFADALRDRYRLERELGRGGMATVYLAQDLKHERWVALKVLRPELAAAIGPDRFIAEIKLTARLNHPHVLPLLDSGEADGFLYYVMPYVEGESLRDRLNREGRLPLVDALARAREAAEALDHAHSNGIVHRDVKPENILLNQGQALLADFGVALAVTRAASDRATVPGLAVGTPRYMSPEQAIGGTEPDARSDIYSLGCVLYEMIAGSPPFKGAALVRPPPPPLRDVGPRVPADLERVVSRCLQFAPDDRYRSARDLLDDLIACQETLTTRTVRLGVLVRRPAILAAIALFLVATTAAGAWLWQRESRNRWARTVALPEAARLIEQGRRYPALRLLRRVERIIPADPILHELLMESSILVTVRTTPPGAQVFLRELGEPPQARELLGRAPLDSIRLPATNLVWEIALDGYLTREALRHFRRRTAEFELQPARGAPVGMVHMPGGRFTLFGTQSVELDDYWIDRYEVTNRQFWEFIHRGGYRRPEYWKTSGGSSAAVPSIEDAEQLFRDRTGHPGPSTWELGLYPEGQADHPVGGISWHEAAAYCTSVGRQLPTAFHWYHAADLGTTLQFAGFGNFAGSRPVQVGGQRTVGTHGTYDMAGNVKEWILNQADPKLRYILGGGWNEPEYQYREHDARPPFDREPTFGVRCAKYSAPLPRPLVSPVAPPSRDRRREVPVGDEVFEVYRSLYRYDRSPLEARIDSVSDRAEHYRVEWLSFAAAYGNERVPAVLYLPTEIAPPYQTVIFAPGAGAFIEQQRMGEAEGQREWFLFLVRSGRAVMVPMFKGTFERYVGALDQPNTWRDIVIHASKDLGRAIDYLETRPEIGARRLAFYGLSAGGGIGQILTAIEPRFQASILMGSGLQFFPQPAEARSINFLPRIKVPTLMINGRKDFFFPLETAQEPMFRLLGASLEHKRHRLFESGHIPLEWQEVTREIHDWLDRYLGPVGSARSADE